MIEDTTLGKAQSRLLSPYSFGALLFAVLSVAIFPFGTTVVAIGAMLVGLLGSAHAMFAILILLLLRVLNPGLSSLETDTADPIGAIALFVCSGRILLDTAVGKKKSFDAIPSFTLPYALTILLLSVAFSWDTTVSTLKTVAFFVPMIAIVAGMRMISDDSAAIRRSAATGWLFVLIVSVPTLAIASIGYLRDGAGFQGILNHPQALAVFLAPVLALSMVEAFTTTGRRAGMFLLLFALSFAFMWLTRGRTALVSFLLSSVLMLVFRPGFWRRATDLIGKALARPWVLITVLMAIPLVLVSGVSIGSFVLEFIFKGSSAAGLSEAYGMSRGFIVEQAVANFQMSPATGIGFGVSNSSTHAFNVQIDPLTGLPVGAATEKANLVLAVVEETGIVGTVMFVPFILSLVRRIARTPDLALGWGAMAALCTNVSEVTFYSFGGIGLYTWLLMAWALAEYAKSRADGVQRPAAITASTVAKLARF